jgi:sugar diacid utilization regulator
MAGKNAGRTTAGAAALDLGHKTVTLLESRLPAVAEQTVRTITVEVPAYANALTGPMGAKIQSAVQLALGGFLRLADSPGGSGAGSPLTPSLDGAYELGRGEARSGRTMDALLAAYRIGARESWRQLSGAAVETGLPSATMAQFAELVFAYIDELSAASAAGHADELATTGRVRERYLRRLTSSILRGDAPEPLLERAQRANWQPPRTLAAVLLPTGHASRALANLDDRTLRADEDLPGVEDDELTETTVLLVSDADGSRRAGIMSALREHGAYLGPATTWTEARVSYLRALRARRLQLPMTESDVCDTDDHLTSLVVSADPAALADLRAQALGPLRDLRPSTADRLSETLRAWLLHQGRRDDVASALHIHPQTVRYRMTQLRDLYGDRLDQPETVLALTIALARTPA